MKKFLCIVLVLALVLACGANVAMGGKNESSGTTRTATAKQEAKTASQPTKPVANSNEADKKKPAERKAEASEKAVAVPAEENTTDSSSSTKTEAPETSAGETQPEDTLVNTPAENSAENSEDASDAGSTVSSNSRDQEADKTAGQEANREADQEADLSSVTTGSDEHAEESASDATDSDSTPQNSIQVKQSPFFGLNPIGALLLALVVIALGTFLGNGLWKLYCRLFWSKSTKQDPNDKISQKLDDVMKYLRTTQANAKNAPAKSTGSAVLPGSNPQITQPTSVRAEMPSELNEKVQAMTTQIQKMVNAMGTMATAMKGLGDLSQVISKLESSGSTFKSAVSSGTTTLNELKTQAQSIVQTTQKAASTFKQEVDALLAEAQQTRDVTFREREQLTNARSAFDAEKKQNAEQLGSLKAKEQQIKELQYNVKELNSKLAEEEQERKAAESNVVALETAKKNALQMAANAQNQIQAIQTKANLTAADAQKKAAQAVADAQKKAAQDVADAQKKAAQDVAAEKAKAKQELQLMQDKLETFAKELSFSVEFWGGASGEVVAQECDRWDNNPTLCEASLKVRHIFRLLEAQVNSTTPEINALNTALLYQLSFILIANYRAEGKANKDIPLELQKWAAAIKNSTYGEAYEVIIPRLGQSLKETMKASFGVTTVNSVESWCIKYNGDTKYSAIVK